MHASLSLALVALCAIAAVNASTGGWTSTGPSHPENPVKFHLPLKHKQPTIIYDTLLAVSDPASPRYGQHLTRSELKALCTPVDNAAAVVSKWLKANGVTSFSLNWSGDIITVRTSTKIASALLSINLETFVQSSKAIIRSTEKYSLPAEVSDYIDTVVGLHAFPLARAEIFSDEANTMAPPASNGNIDPQTLRQLYGVDESFSGGSGSTQALAEFQLEGYSTTDLSKFLSHYNLPSQTVRNITGKGKSPEGHAEANLDVQYIMVTGQQVPTDFYLQGGEGFDLLQWIDDTANDPNSALVWSVSYGEDIKTIVSSFGDTYPARFNTEVAKLGTLGKSVIFASGDSGVYSRQGSFGDFRPDFPAALPAVTGVGATLLNGDGSEDTGTSFSGGGFCYSQYFNRTAYCPYQNTAVSKFFSTSTNLPPANLYDANGCGYPDVSAQGVNFMVYINGLLTPVSGTSASCPTFAGIVALLNDARLSAGKAPLGWLNPFLYANPQAFNDMTKGLNKGPGFHGFEAIAGWDPVTGMGTPNYPELKKAALSAP